MNGARRARAGFGWAVSILGVLGVGLGGYGRDGEGVAGVSCVNGGMIGLIRG